MPESPNLPGRRPVGACHRRRRSSATRPAAVRGLIVVALAMLGSLVWAPAASAHDELVDLEPGNKATVSTPPTEVQLVFGASPMVAGTRIRVTGPRGTVVSTGPATIDGGAVVQKLTGGLANGVYRVDWRVTASDGHPVSGTYTWILRATPATASTPAAASTLASAPATAPASPVPSASGGSAEGTSSGSSPGLVVGLSVLAVAVAGTGFALVHRRHGASVSGEGDREG
jgi:methionine-rich copper-binding protein CopC